MKIKRIVEIDSVEPVYDIEVGTADHTFMIGNTRVENCRLLSDTTKLSSFKQNTSKQDLQIAQLEIEKLYKEYCKDGEAEQH